MEATEVQTSQSHWPARSEEDDLKNAALQVHSALQWLARVMNSYSHQIDEPLVMQWIPSERAIRTPEFVANVFLEMRLPQFVLQFQERGVRTRYPIVLDESSPAEVEAWLRIELLHRNLDTDRFSRELPYDVSHLLSGDASHFQTEDRQAAFDDLADWLSTAGSILCEASGHAPGAATVPLQLRARDFALFMKAPVAKVDASGARGGEIGFTATSESVCFYRAAADGEASAGRDLEVLPVKRILEEQLDPAALIDFLQFASRP
jgi:hypothetical protein